MPDNNLSTWQINLILSSYLQHELVYPHFIAVEVEVLIYHGDMLMKILR